LRVIAGIAKGKPLAAPKGQNTRPTTDRVKESLFAVIQFDVAGRSVLDLFAGSGALGIEALSRGAENAVFVDERSDCIDTVLENLGKTGLAEKARAIKADFISVLRKLQGEKFSLVFLDPPYRAGYYEKALSALIEYALLMEDAIVVMEKDADENIAIPAYFEAFKEKRYGGTALVYLKKA